MWGIEQTTGKQEAKQDRPSCAARRTSSSELIKTRRLAHGDKWSSSATGASVCRRNPQVDDRDDGRDRRDGNPEPPAMGPRADRVDEVAVEQPRFPTEPLDLVHQLARIAGQL